MLLSWKHIVFLSLIALKPSSSFVSEGHLKLYGYVSVPYLITPSLNLKTSVVVLRLQNLLLALPTKSNFSIFVFLLKEFCFLSKLLWKRKWACCAVQTLLSAGSAASDLFNYRLTNCRTTVLSLKILSSYMQPWSICQLLL